MIRDLTKSTVSFSWGMTMLGAQQVVNLMSGQSPAQPTHKAATTFNAVTQAAEAQLGETLKGALKVGDQLQQGLLDLTFSLFSLQALNPSEFMQAASDMMTKTVSAYGPGMPGGMSGSQQDSSGWGPVPPPGS